MNGLPVWPAWGTLGHHPVQEEGGERPQHKVGAYLVSWLGPGRLKGHFIFDSGPSEPLASPQPQIKL